MNARVVWRLQHSGGPNGLSSARVEASRTGRRQVVKGSPRGAAVQGQPVLLTTCCIVARRAAKTRAQAKQRRRMRRILMRFNPRYWAHVLNKNLPMMHPDNKVSGRFTLCVAESVRTHPCLCPHQRQPPHLIAVQVRLALDGVIVVLVLYNCFMVPYQVSRYKGLGLGAGASGHESGVGHASPAHAKLAPNLRRLDFPRRRRTCSTAWSGAWTLCSPLTYASTSARPTWTPLPRSCATAPRWPCTTRAPGSPLT